MYDKLKKLADVAEMLMVVICNVSEGDWSKQTGEWQEIARKWIDEYMKVVKEVGIVKEGEKEIK